MINTTTMGIFMLGHRTQFVFARRKIVESVLASDWPIAPEGTLSDLRREIPMRPVFVLTDRPEVVAKLRDSRRFHVRYDMRGWTILEFAR